MIYKTRKRYRGEPICADPTADPRENETALHFTAGDRRLWISSYDPTVVSGLLAHPDFQVGHLILMQANGQECVVGVVGKLPVGALSIGRARKSDSHELIVKAHLRVANSQIAAKEPKTKREEPRQLKLKLAQRGELRTFKRKDRKRRASDKKGRVHSKRRASARRPRRRGQRNR